MAWQFLMVLIGLAQADPLSRDVGTPEAIEECAPPVPFEEAVTAASAIFSGEVVRVSEPIGRVDALVARVEVQRVWKGEVSREVDVWTLKGGEGFSFHAGVRYLVFTQSWPGETRLWTSICTRTNRLGLSGDDLARLGEGRSTGGVDGEDRATGRR